jgi:hypothetical protein
MDPLRMVTVSYGENAPLQEGSARLSQNRRVEILVYRDGITSTAATSAKLRRLSGAASPQSQRRAKELLNANSHNNFGAGEKAEPRLLTLV